MSMGLLGRPIMSRNCPTYVYLSGSLLFKTAKVLAKVRTTGGFCLLDQLLYNIQNSVSQIIHAKLPTFLPFVVVQIIKMR